MAGVESGSVSWEEAARKLGGHRLMVFILLPGDGRYGSDDSESGGFVSRGDLVPAFPCFQERATRPAAEGYSDLRE